MELSALSHSHDPGVERHPGGRRSRYVSLAMVVALTTVLGACSGARTSETAQRGPSLRIADAALASGAPEMALRVADLILAKQPRNAAALTMRGDALYAMGRYDMARGAYRASIAIDPKDAGPRVGLGRILARSNPSAAEDALLGALKLDPDNVVALNNLGVVRDLQGHNAKAREAYDRALALAPDSPDVEINLGTSLALSGQKADAVRLLRGVASNAGAARVWRKEILSGLTLAGDGAWAREQLRADRFQTPREPVAANTRTRLAAGVASPSVGPIGSGGHAIRQTERFRPVDSGVMPNSPANGMLDNPISDAAVGTIPRGHSGPGFASRPPRSHWTVRTWRSRRSRSPPTALPLRPSILPGPRQPAGIAGSIAASSGPGPDIKVAVAQPMAARFGSSPAPEGMPKAVPTFNWAHCSRKRTRRPNGIGCTGSFRCPVRA